MSAGPGIRFLTRQGGDPYQIGVQKNRSGRRGKLFDFIRIASLAAFLCPVGGHAADDKEKLPVPRFVSLKHGEANLRVGPGRRYPISWVYKRRDMPVEIVSEFDIWRKIRDWQGTEGWVIEQAVSGNRGFIVTGDIRALHRDADENATLTARLEPGVIGKILECPQKSPDWCRVETNGAKGWIKRDEMWGVYSTEFIQ